MKKLLIILSLVTLISGCVVIEERYTGPRVRIEPDSYYYDYSPGYYNDYYPMYGYYSNYSFSPYSWFGLSIWNPFYYYGLYNSYWSNYYPSRYGRSVLTKRQLKNWRKYGDNSGRKIRTSSGKSGRSTGRSTSVSRTRGTRVRSTSTRGSSSTRVRGTSSRGSRGTKIKKKK